MKLNGLECKFVGVVSSGDYIKIQFQELITGQGRIHNIELDGQECGDLLGSMEQCFQKWAKKEWEEVKSS